MRRSDDQLLEAARAGDAASLNELVERHMPVVRRFASKLCRDPEDAKDVLQDTLLGATRGLGRFRGDASLGTWLYALARSFCIKRRRSSKFAPSETLSLEQTREAADVRDAARAPDDASFARELTTALEAAIAELPPDYREVLVLRDVDGLTAPQVASTVGVTVSAVKSRLHRARAQVRARLESKLAGG